ncbi:MAG: hypothetical protein AAFR21_05335 [Pseudomonadota bacterium]
MKKLAAVGCASLCVFAVSMTAKANAGVTVNAASKTEIKTEKGVSVYRGPAKQEADFGLAGGEAMQPSARRVNVNVRVRCVDQPRRLVTHGFGTGYRPIYRARGFFPVNRFTSQR